MERSNHLIDRYLDAVRFWLPRESKDDIVRELGENLQSQMDDKSERLGRPLTEAEEAAILKQHGSPMLAGGRYWPQQYLIGPGVFVVYRVVLKVSVFLSAVASLIVGITRFQRNDLAGSVIGALLEAAHVALITFAWVTIVFAALSLMQTHLKSLDEWDPRSLPAAPLKPKGPTRFEPASELLASLFGILWWIAVPSYPFLIFGPAAAFLTLTPAWQSFYVPVIILAVVSVLVHACRLMRPDLIWLKQVVAIGGRAVALAVIALMLNAGPLIAVRGGDGSAHAGMAEVLNVTITVALQVSSVIAVLKLVWAIVILIKDFPKLFGTKVVML